MRKNFGKMKPLSKILAALSLSAALGISSARADSVDVPFLTNIQDYTNQMLAVVNQLPTYMGQLATLATTFLASDDASSDPVNWSTNWSNEQSWLASLGTDALTNEAAQASMQQSLLTTFFGSANITAASPQNMNDLSFTTLLGQPLLSPDPRSGANPSLNYITNASGLGIKYPAPTAGMRGKQTDQAAYTSFYNTITSVQTYNAYLLGRLYQDSQTLSSDTSLRKQLITQSSNSSWFTSVISNDLGWVLRQLLLYSSQSYVLMDQMLQAQKQMVASLAMTNALLVANSGFQAQSLLAKAQG